MDDSGQARLAFRLPLDEPGCTIHFSPPTRTSIKDTLNPPSSPNLLVHLPNRDGELLHATLSGRSLQLVRSDVEAVLWLTSSRFLVLDRLNHDLVLFRVIRDETGCRYVCTFHHAFSSLASMLLEHGVSVKTDDAVQLVSFHVASSCLRVMVRQEYLVQMAVDEGRKNMQILMCLRLGNGLVKGSCSDQALTLLFQPLKITATVISATQFECFLKLPLRMTEFFTTGSRKEMSIVLKALTPDCQWLVVVTIKPFSIFRLSVQNDILKTNENPSNVFQHLHMSRLQDPRIQSSSTADTVRRTSTVSNSKGRSNAVWEQEVMDVVSKNNALQNSFEAFQTEQDDGNTDESTSWRRIAVPEEYSQSLPCALHCTNTEIYIVAHRDTSSRHLILGVKKLTSEEDCFWTVFEEDCHIHFPITTSYPITLVYPLSVTVIAANEDQGFQRELAQAAAPDPWNDLEPLSIMEMVLQQHHQQPSKDTFEKAVEYLHRRYPQNEEFTQAEYHTQAAFTIAKNYLTTQNYAQAAQVLQWVDQPVLGLVEGFFMETMNRDLRTWSRDILKLHWPDSITLKEAEGSFAYLKLLEEIVGVEEGSSWTLTEVSRWSDEERRRRLLQAALKKRDAALVDTYSTEEELWFYLIEDEEGERLLRWVSGENHNDVTKRSIPDAVCEQVFIDIEKAELRDAVLNGFARRGVYSHREIQNWRTFLLRMIGAFDDLSAIEEKFPPFLRMQFVQFVLHYRLTPLVLTLFKEAEVSEGLSLEHRWLKPFLQLRKAVFVDAGAEGALAIWCGDSLVDIYGVSEGAMVKDLLDKGESVNVWDLLGALILFQKEWPMKGGSEIHKALIPFQKHLQRFHPLYEALFPPEATSAKDQRSKLRVSVYSALQKTASCHYEVSKLFGWQSSHTLNTLYRLPDMPAFSNEALQLKYGYKKDLDFVYYLKNARPAFAYWSFVAHLSANSSANNFKDELSAARDMAYYVAMISITNEAITRSCVAFVEMLNSDSMPLRISLQMFHHLHTQQKNTGRDSSVQSTAFIELYKYGGEVAGSFLQSWPQSQTSNWDELIKQRLLLHQFAQLFNLKKLAITQGLPDNDWLSFLLLCDLFQYPLTEVAAALPQVFSHPHLRQNLRCVLQMVKAAKRESVVSETSNKDQRNVRSSLYQKIGMGGSAKALAASDRTSSSASEDDRSSVMKKRDELMMSEPPVSMIAALSNSLHRSLLSWKTLLNISLALSSPIYAMMAASEPGAHQISVLAVILYTSLSLDNRRRFHLSVQLPPSSAMADFHWSLHQHVEPLGLLFIGDDLPLLETAFTIVAVHSVVQHMVTLASDIQQGADGSAMADQLRKILTLLKARASPSKKDNDSLNESTIEGEFSLENVQWGTSYGLKVLSLAMSQLKNSNVRQWRQALQLIKDSALLRFVNGESSSSDGVEGSVKDMTTDMLELLPTSSQSDASRLDELKSLLQDFQRSSLWHNEVFRMEVWRSISRRIHVELRQEQSVGHVIKLLDDAVECATLLEQCLLTHILCKLDDSDTRFRQAWTHKLAYGQTRNNLSIPVERWMDELNMEKSMNNSITLQTELLNSITSKPTTETNDSDNKEASGISDVLDQVISVLLEKCKLSCALRLARVFGQRNAEVDLLCWVLTVALQDRLPDSSADTWPLSLRNTGRIDVSRAQSLEESPIGLGSNASLRRSASERNDKDSPVEECLKKALSVARSARAAIAAILDLHNLAKLLSVPLDNILRFDAVQIVDGLLTRPAFLQPDHQLHLARRCLLMIIQPISHCSLSAIIGQHIITTARKTVTDRSSDSASSMADSLRPYWSLALDQSSLANCLLDTVQNSTTTLQTNPDDIEVRLNVELLIIINHIINRTETSTTRSEDQMSSFEAGLVRSECTTVSRLLEVSKALSKVIASAGQFPWLIRLLQGVGRYSDMTFIFHLIKQADQMELLFSRHVEKDSKLKTAILSYLRRFHPQDQEAFEMLAAAYSMHRDIAEMYWETAQGKLALFKHRPISDTKETQGELKAIIQYMMDALSSFTRAHCHARADEVLMQARLVALQIVFLPAGLRLLTLNNPSGFVASHPSFAEAFIYAQAYDIVDEWADALYTNYVFSSDITYLQDFTVKFEVTTSLISKVASRFKMDTTKPPTAAIYMKKLLRLLKDIPLAYQLANELGLNDLSVELIQIDNASYLRDIVEI